MKISIIIPVYNVENYVESCLNSAINQSYLDLEIIVINDGSTDNSLNICKKFTKDLRVKLITKENGGLSQTRNIGLQKSTGDTIIFLDGDDTLPLEAIEKMVERMKESKSDLVVGGKSYYNSSNELIRKDINTDISREYFSSLKYLEESIKKDKFHPSSCGKLYRRDIIMKNKILFPEGFLYEDLIFSLKYLECCNKISVYDESVYNYLVFREGSITKTLKIKDLDSLELVKRIYIYLESKNSELIKSKIVKNYLVFWINKILLYKIFLKDTNYEKKELKKIYIKLKEDSFYVEKLKEYISLKETPFKFRFVGIIFLININLFIGVLKIYKFLNKNGLKI